MLKTLLFVVSLLLGVNAEDYDYAKEAKQNPRRIFRSYQTEGKPKTIHVVPHSHDDVGWLKTVDQYFYGDRNDIQRTMVGVELTSIISSLLADPRRTFSEVEMKFFKMWWDEQTEDMKEKTRGLVQSGQLELINAGWSMHDEACPIYEDMIDNMMIGHDFIFKEFGVKPRIGWQIDPFGHSNTNARLFAEMGFDAWFFARLDYQDKQRRYDTNEFEFVWMPNPKSLGKDVQIFTHVLYNHYSAPPGCDFEIDSSSPVFVSNPESKDFNAEAAAQKLMDHLDDRVKHYMTDDIFVLFGDDFRYKAAAWNYRNLDALIDYMNEKHGDKYFFKYSTPSQYVDTLAAKTDIYWPTKYDDMFPYSHADTDWWTGYFSSRANAKGYIRRASSNLHSSATLIAKKMLDQSADDQVTEAVLDANYGMLDALGILQHHDAVTGTAKQAVANDYNKRLYQSMEVNNIYYGNLIAEEVFKQYGVQSNDWQQCQKTNSSYLDCPISDKNFKEQGHGTVNIAVHNPSSLDLKSVKVAIAPDTNFDVFIIQANDNATQSEFKPALAEKSCFDDYIQGNGTVDKIMNCHMEIRVDVPAQGVKLIQMNYTAIDKQVPNVFIDGPSAIHVNQTITGNGLHVTYKGHNKEEATIMFDVYDEVSKTTEEFEFSMRYYESYNFMIAYEYMNSGAYAFHPMEGQLHPYPYGEVKSVAIQKGDLTQQLHISFGKHLYGEAEESMTSIVHVSIDKDLPLLKIDVDLGSLPFQEKFNGYEVVPNFHLKNFDQKRTFYTDSNGLEMQKRVQDYRETWELNTTQKVTDNYYPIGSAISIKDFSSQRQLTVMNDRAQGGTSIAPGTVELMQNREAPSDDNKGLGEPLQEKDEFGNGIRVKATYHVQIFDGAHRPSLQRVAQQKINDPANFFFNFDKLNHSPLQDKSNNFGLEYKAAGVTDTVKVVHIPKTKNLIHVRLQNIADLYDGANAKTHTVDLHQIAVTLWNSANQFAPQAYDQILINELSLTGNMFQAEMLAKKIKWKTVDDEDTTQYAQCVVDRSEVDPKAVTLEPQRIRVFSIEYVPSHNVDRFLNP